MYKIIGTDGKTYGPVDAGLIKQWIAENRVERQTPVYVAGAADWTFLGLVPEFAGLFAPATPAPGPSPISPPPSGTMAGSVPPTSSLAILGFISGILSLTCVCCCCFGVPFSLAGLVLSCLALSQINRQPELYSGRGMAIAGIVLSALSLFFFVMATIYQLAISPGHTIHYNFQGF